MYSHNFIIYLILIDSFKVGESIVQHLNNFINNIINNFLKYLVKLLD
jgi:hypothetical protein